MGPNEKYPYGIEKLKNIVVLIPSILFVYLGSEILVESATSFIDSHEEVSSHFSLTSTLVSKHTHIYNTIKYFNLKKFCIKTIVNLIFN